MNEYRTHYGRLKASYLAMLRGEPLGRPCGHCKRKYPLEGASACEEISRIYNEDQGYKESLEIGSDMTRLLGWFTAASQAKGIQLID